MRLFRNPHPVAMFSAWFLIVFNVLFPKGGFKLGPLPITWGYLFIALSAPVLAVFRLLVFPLRYRPAVYAAVLMLLPMQLLYAYAGIVYGVQDASFAFADFVGLFILPWLFLLIYPPFLNLLDGKRLSLYLRWSITIAALWGILLFFLHPITGHFIEIPYLTVNAADYGELELTKNLSRGLFLKLIATYNNGNLYGVATLILLPMYDQLETVRWRRIALKLALVLTLSRTVWIGLVLNETLPLLVLLARQTSTFPVLYLGRAGRRFLAVLLTASVIFASLLLNNAGLNFLLDPTGGGRVGMLKAVLTATWLPSQPLQAFRETVYTSAADLYGFVGMFAFLLIMISPLLLLALDTTALRSPLRRAALKGLVLYSAMAAIDGAINYLPVMAFYWFAYMIYIHGWPGERDTKSVSAGARSSRTGHLYPSSGPELANSAPAVS